MKTPRQTSAARVRAYLAEHPGASIDTIASDLSLSYSTVKDVRRMLVVVPSQRTPAPTLMRAGSGEREDGCARYEECLSGAADRYPQAAHCPEGCESYQDRDHSIDRAIASSVARESQVGGLGEAPMWASGGEW